MTKPQPNDLVYVIVHERPNLVWVCCNGAIHTARWRTVEAGGFGDLRDVIGNRGFLHGALCAWDGQGAFTARFTELEKRSGGWGAWTDE